MKFSENWLREFVNPPQSTKELVEQLTMAGLEVDGFEPVASDFSDVVVGEIVSVEKHPDAEKLVVCKVDGGSEQFQVVCGAPNARPGIKIPFALVGAKLSGSKIKKAKLRGVESFGMLCSERELGLSDSHEGLMELPADAPVGDNIREYLQLEDAIIDLDLTPNRSDCLGIKGLARETGLLNELDVNYPEITPVLATIDDTFPVELANPETCPRFVGRVIRNINLQAETPLWMKEKLRRCDVRSIDPVVDVTNYIMLELNHPMHAYDLARLTDKIIVRQSTAGEKITLLDSQEITLHEDTVLITDGSGPIGMAGVMGGLTTSVTSETTDIFLECAWFAPTSIAGQARSYALNTDAAHRFERGVDWQGQQEAMERGTALLLDITGGEAGPIIDTVVPENLPSLPDVPLRASRIKRLLGVAIDDVSVEGMLQRLSFKFVRTDAADDTHWLVKAPSHRFDIAIEADLIEEISRVYGYNTLPVRTPQSSLAMPELPESHLTLPRIRDQLVARGYQESISYSFVDPAVEALLDPEQRPIELANPLSGDMSVMRTTLWTGLIKSLIYNLNRQQNRVRLFEVGLRFRQKNPDNALTFDGITQDKTIAGVACGPRAAENWATDAQAVDFYDIKGDLESVLGLSGDVFEFRAGAHPALQSGQVADVYRDDELVGHVGLLDPRVQKKLDIRVPIYLFELKIEFIITKMVPEAVPLSRFPEVRRDLAIIVDRAVEAINVRKCVNSVADSSLTNLKLFDVYQGKGIDPNRKSLALGLTFRHASRTLTDEEINDSISKIVASLEADFGASLRS
jgi:phenylalanyl-tRNA synthetase beta chain